MRQTAETKRQSKDQRSLRQVNSQRLQTLRRKKRLHPLPKQRRKRKHHPHLLLNQNQLQRKSLRKSLKKSLRNSLKLQRQVLQILRSEAGKSVEYDSRLSINSAMLTVPQVKMNRMRLRIAERLKQSQNTAASLTTFNEVDMSSLMEFRKLYKDDVLKKTGVKLGFMSAFSKACVLAMKDIPAANASIEGPNGGDTIVYRDYVDISVAVATEKGLVTPVVRNAESLDLVGIEKAIADLGKKVRSSYSKGFVNLYVSGAGQQVDH